MTPPCSAPLSSIWNVSPADLDAVIYNQTLRFEVPLSKEPQRTDFLLKLGAVKAGYAPIKGLCFPACAVFVDEVALVERDQLVGMFGHGTSLEGADRWWWINHLWNREGVMANVNLEDMEGYDELTAKFLASLPVELTAKFLATLPVELTAKFLATLPVELRLKGLAPEERFKGLATEELRAMLEELRRRLKEQE